MSVLTCIKETTTKLFNSSCVIWLFSDQTTVNDYFTLSTIKYFDWFPLHTRRRKLIVLHINLVNILTGNHFQSEKQSKGVFKEVPSSVECGVSSNIEDEIREFP